jgi:hypothetical protein
MAEQPSGFKDLLNKMMSRRWYITAMVLGGFIVIIAGIFAAISLANTNGRSMERIINVIIRCLYW